MILMDSYGLLWYILMDRHGSSWSFSHGMHTLEVVAVSENAPQSAAPGKGACSGLVPRVMRIRLSAAWIMSSMV